MTPATRTDPDEGDARRLGACIRSVSLLLQQGADAAAHDVADAFAESCGGGALAADALCAFIREAELTVHGREETVVVEGERTDSVYVVISGQAAVRREGAGQLALLGPGEFFGEIAATTGTARTATVAAVEVCEVVRLSRRGLTDLTRYLPPVASMLAATGRARLLPTMFPVGGGFEGLNDLQRAKLFEYFVPVTVPAGTRILREAQQGAGLCVLVSGTVEVWRSQGSRREVLARLGPGACFGEISLLFNLQVTANVEAVGPVTLFALKPADFKRFVELFPDIGAYFVRLAEDRMGTPRVDRRFISAEHHIIDASARMNYAERAAFTTSSGYTTGVCPACGYEDADILCVSCGAVQ